MFLFNRPPEGNVARDATNDTTKQRGDAGEDAALRHLLAQGLRLVARNYRTPGRGGGEIDLIMQDTDGTTVFVEVRKRASTRAASSAANSSTSGAAGRRNATLPSFGGAAASVSAVKQQRIIFAAQHYLMRLPQWPPCRFDVVALDGDALTWIKAAFDAG